MLKNSDKYQNSTHFSYNEKRYKQDNKNQKDLVVFIAIFFVGVLVLLGFAKILSPNVDVEIAGEDEYNVVNNFDDNDITSGNIDERLKNLKKEDDGQNGENSEIFSPEYDEKVILPKQKKKTVGEIEAEIQNKKELQPEKEMPELKSEPPKTHKTETMTAPLPPQKDESKQISSTQIVNAKVVVGYYSTEKQAEVAKTIIQDAGIGVNPIVKNMDGYYTLQVGAYTSKEKAQQAANHLLKSNFPARVIVE